jgi:hypothetical protein
MSWIAPYDAAGTRERIRHRLFYAKWPEVIDQYDVTYSQDVRDMPQYRAAHARHAVAVSEPTINPDTGAPIIAVGYPIERDGLVVGIVTANITMDALSQFLASHRASPNALTIIANRLGTMIAHPVPASVVRRDGSKLTVAKIGQLGDAQIVAAAVERERRGQDRFTFTVGPNGQEYAASFSAIPDSAAWDWEVAVVAPTDDFVGALRRTSQLLILVMLAVALVESVLIHYMARVISRPIETVSKKIEEVRSLQFGVAPPASSRIREIVQLQRALALLSNALRSFSAFVPVDIVRGLIESGHALSPGVDGRKKEIMVYELLGIIGSTDPDLAPARKPQS